MEPLDARLTEQRHPGSVAIDELDTLDIVDLINAEDRMVAPAVAAEREHIALAVDLVVDSFGRGGRLIYVGAGTSGRLGVLDAAEMPPTFRTGPGLVQGIIAGGPDALVAAMEGAEDDTAAGERDIDACGIGPADFVLGIATSGTTPYVHAALARARLRGARTGFLLCNEPSPELHGMHDVVIAPIVGPEVITGSTRMKAGTATKLVLNTISTAAMVRIGKVYGNLMVDVGVHSNKLRDRGERILMETLGLDREGAAGLLVSADGEVKTAIVMSRLGVPADEARARIEAAGGVIRAVTGAAHDRPDVGYVDRRDRRGARPFRRRCGINALGTRGVPHIALQCGSPRGDPTGHRGR